jgi:hypothetical protein
VLNKFTVVDADVKWLTLPNGTLMNVDWDCWDLGITVDTCSDLYIQQMRTVQAGFVLTHNRTADLSGAYGDVRPATFASLLVSKASAAGMQFVAPDAVPGLLGNVRATGFTKVSSEFGSNNGEGPVVFADITGNGLADACKAFGHTIRCMMADGKDVLDNQARSQNRSGFLPSTNWITVDDPGWVADYNRQFWLVDFDGNGVSALVLPGKNGTSNGFWVAPSDGTGSFGPMSFSPMHFGGWTSQLLQTVRFADIDGDGLVDVVAEVGGNIVWSANLRTAVRSQTHGFSSPKVLVSLPSGIDWTNPAYGSTLLVGDINGDGHPDLVVRGSLDVFVSLNRGNGQFPALTSWSRRFPDSQGWSNASQYQTLAIATIGGNTGLAGGASTGIVFHQADPAHSKFTLYRYLNNQEFSVVPGWHPDWQPSQLSFAHLAQGTDDWPVMVKEGGLFVAPVVVEGKKTASASGAGF